MGSSSNQMHFGEKRRRARAQNRALVRARWGVGRDGLRIGVAIVVI